MNVTILLTTCDRYDTTLSLCLMSIFNQSYTPSKIILIDDSKEKKFYDYQIFKNILKLFKYKNIEFEYFYGECKGAVHALQIGLNNINDGWVLKMDDDNILSYNVLEIFINNIKDNIGAMSGIIIDDYLYKYYLNNLDRKPNQENGIYNKIENIFSEMNIQMIHDQSEDIKKVEHIYSNYFFRRDVADNYPLELSPSSHREETIFTYNIYKKGYDMIIIPIAKIYHLYYDRKSGNRKWGKDYSKKNELFFIEKLKEWGIIPNKLNIIIDGDKYCVKKNGSDVLYILNI